MDGNRKRFALYISALTLFRLIYINLVPIIPQEAYYWKYAKNLALSYFDHPPMAAYTIAFFTWIGGDAAFFIRLGCVLYSTGMMILLFRCAEELFHDSRLALLSAITISCTVMYSIGATFITPDVPFLFFWTLIVFSLIKLKNSGHARWWYIAGAALGFALLSKYTAILIVPGILIYLLLSQSERKWLLTVHPFAASVLAMIFFMPVILWNYQNDWASFLFQSSRRFSEMNRFRFDFFFQLIGSQLMMLTPYIFFVTITGWIHSGRMALKRKHDDHALLFWIAAPVIVLFTFSSFRSLVKMNWLAPAYITALMAGIAWVYSGRSKMTTKLKKWFKPGLIIGLVLVMIMHILPIYPIAPIRRGDTWTGWQELAERIETLRSEMSENTFIFSHEYKIPSQITYYSSQHLQTHAGEVIGENGLQYEFWTDLDRLVGCDAIFVTSNAGKYRKMARIEQHFDRVVPVEPVKIDYHSRTFRIFYLYKCYQYKGHQNLP
ncbi:MAG: glycosyltransferase family 39 protein [candidate division KSB1 bacterium]|nr:glycosyltransferase family 39 protein [candidate division KSB1 bacterium]